MVDRHQVRRALDDIARQDVPDTVDLWGAIQAQIDAEDTAERRAHQRSWLLRTSQVAAAVLLAVIIGVGTLTTVGVMMSRMANPATDTKGSVEVAALYTDLGLTQVRDDVTFTVERAFADSNQAVIDYTYVIAGASPNTYVGTPRLTTADGVELPASFMVGNGVLMTGESAAQYRFDMSPLTALTPSVDLTMEVKLMPGGEDAINGGGGGPAMAHGGSAWVQRDDVSGRDVTFVFHFTLPIIPEMVIEGLPPQTVNGVQVDLQRVRIAPSQTQLTICMSVPDTALDWVPVLTISNGDFSRTTVPYQVASQTETQSCHVGRYVLPYLPDVATDWTVEVQFLRSSFADTVANGQRLEARLIAQGITAEIDTQGTGEQILILPGELIPGDEAMTDFDLMVEAALAELGQRLDGPWMFRFTVE